MAGVAVCPAHGGDSQVRRVAAVCEEQVASVDINRPFMFVTPGGLGVGRMVGRDVQATALARSLVPYPLTRRSSVAMIVISLAGGVAGGIFCRISGGAYVGVPLLVLSVTGLAAGLAVLGRNQNIDAGKGSALAVFFAPGDEPAGVAPSAALTPGEFQNLVWSAGGYARLTPVLGPALMVGLAAAVIAGVVVTAEVHADHAAANAPANAPVTPPGAGAVSLGATVTSLDQLVAGMCLGNLYANGPWGAPVDVADTSPPRPVVVPCDQPHDAQTFGGSGIGGEADLTAADAAEFDAAVCRGTAARYYTSYTSSPDLYQVTVIYDSRTFKRGDLLRESQCIFEGSSPHGLLKILR